MLQSPGASNRNRRGILSLLPNIPTIYTTILDNISQQRTLIVLPLRCDHHLSLLPFALSPMPPAPHTPGPQLSAGRRYVLPLASADDDRVILGE